MQSQKAVKTKEYYFTTAKMALLAKEPILEHKCNVNIYGRYTKSTSVRIKITKDNLTRYFLVEK
jgi:hypothetical protein